MARMTISFFTFYIVLGTILWAGSFCPCASADDVLGREFLVKVKGRQVSEYAVEADLSGRPTIIRSSILDIKCVHPLEEARRFQSSVLRQRRLAAHLGHGDKGEGVVASQTTPRKAGYSDGSSGTLMPRKGGIITTRLQWINEDSKIQGVDLKNTSQVSVSATFFTNTSKVELNLPEGTKVIELGEDVAKDNSSNLTVFMVKPSGTGTGTGADWNVTLVAKSKLQLTALLQSYAKPTTGEVLGNDVPITTFEVSPHVNEESRLAPTRVIKMFRGPMLLLRLNRENGTQSGVPIYHIPSIVDKELFRKKDEY